MAENNNPEFNYQILLVSNQSKKEEYEQKRRLREAERENRKLVFEQKMKQMQEINDLKLQLAVEELENKLDDQLNKDRLEFQQKEIERKEKTPVHLNYNPLVYNPFLIYPNHIGTTFQIMTSSSVIINSSHHILFTWLQQSSANLNHTQLLYRGSSHGYLSTNFHTYCDNRGPTLVLVRANGYIFGGYNPSSWNTSGSYIVNVNTFLFSLTNPTSNPMKLTNTGSHSPNTHSSYNNSSYGPTFGAAHDLHINNNMKTNSNYCNIGHSYSSPHQHGSAQSQQFLCGSRNFVVDEIEVWLLN